MKRLQHNPERLPLCHPQASEDFQGGFQRDGRPLLLEVVDCRPADAGKHGQLLLA